MNKANKIAVSGIAGTALMTGDSYLMSLLMSENFREPQHLSTMIARLAPQLSKQAKVIAGWGAHLAMGLIFAAVYVELWESKKIRPTIRNGIILGIASGILGLLIWKANFKLHPLPPRINFNKYYWQRIPAHVVFTVAATLAYRISDLREVSEKPFRK
jgi:Na+/H+ antiporter NhaA